MRYDIFCRVVDNFGDAAVCWRLARQLANEQGHVVRLWLDQLAALAILRPELDRNASHQSFDSVEVIQWSSAVGFEDTGDVVIEGFGCGLPNLYMQSMGARTNKPLWIVLEYLSAEAWVAKHHGLPSPHPSIAVPRYFFFPGFSRNTGGLLRESHLLGRREAFLADGNARRSLWAELGFPAPDREQIAVSLFGYDNPNAGALIDAFAKSAKRIVAVVPPCRLRQQICAIPGIGQRQDGDSLRRGQLELRFIPFLPQPRYDELLWACDWNFVRGEDSFVRAQWAKLPFVWHIYPQSEQAHIKKLDAFLDLYLDGLDARNAVALTGLWRAWNGSGQLIDHYWNQLCEARDTLRRHAQTWGDQLADMPDLAANLANFCSERLK
ncbi:MAG: elongation factor P maturation arginine rhamnosyltransferase EarP [Burkholderiales bacterium]